MEGDKNEREHSLTAHYILSMLAEARCTPSRTFHSKPSRWVSGIENGDSERLNSLFKQLENNGGEDP